VELARLSLGGVVPHELEGHCARGACGGWAAGLNGCAVLQRSVDREGRGETEKKVETTLLNFLETLSVISFAKPGSGHAAHGKLKQSESFLCAQVAMLLLTSAGAMLCASGMTMMLPQETAGMALQDTVGETGRGGRQGKNGSSSSGGGGEEDAEIPLKPRP
jgi:hypothetical protein